MAKKLFIYLFLGLFMLQTSVFAIDWVELTSPRGKVVYLDKDSVRKIDNHLFYNIKYQNSNNSNYTVVTIESGVKHPFSARIKFYPENEYTDLAGDYDNIAINHTTHLEPITFDSVVYTCYREASDILDKKRAPLITF